MQSAGHAGNPWAWHPVAAQLGPLQAQSPAWWVWGGFPAKFKEELTPPAPSALPSMLICMMEKLQVSGGAGILTGTSQPPTPHLAGLWQASRLPW